MHEYTKREDDSNISHQLNAMDEHMVEKIGKTICWRERFVFSFLQYCRYDESIALYVVGSFVFDATAARARRARKHSMT